jgi:hypothetical protein
VFARGAAGELRFHCARAPSTEDLDAIVARTARRAIAWLRRHGYLDDPPLEARSDQLPEQTALDACAAMAMGRGNVVTVSRDSGEEDDGHGAGDEAPDYHALVVDRGGFNLHAAVRIAAGDDPGRERLLRYAARPPLSLERLRRLPGGRVGYRLKYVARGRRGKYRIMTGVEFLARLAAIICPPRYPLVRFAGVLAPRSAWRRDVVPQPRERQGACASPLPQKRPRPSDKAEVDADSAGAGDQRATPPSSKVDRAQSAASVQTTPSANDMTASASALCGPLPGEVIPLAPNIVSVKHWDRLLGGLLYAVQPRVDWATLLRRSFSLDALECPMCHGRLRVVAVIAEREPVQRILAHLAMPTEAPPLARARDPTDDEGDQEDAVQLAFDLA